MIGMVDIMMCHFRKTPWKVYSHCKKGRRRLGTIFFFFKKNLKINEGILKAHSAKVILEGIFMLHHALPMVFLQSKGSWAHEEPRPYNKKERTTNSLINNYINMIPSIKYKPTPRTYTLYSLLQKNLHVYI